MAHFSSEYSLDCASVCFSRGLVFACLGCWSSVQWVWTVLGWTQGKFGPWLVGSTGYCKVLSLLLRHLQGQKLGTRENKKQVNHLINTTKAFSLGKRDLEIRILNRIGNPPRPLQNDPVIPWGHEMHHPIQWLSTALDCKQSSEAGKSLRQLYWGFSVPSYWNRNGSLTETISCTHVRWHTLVLLDLRQKPGYNLYLGHKVWYHLLRSQNYDILPFYGLE